MASLIGLYDYAMSKADPRTSDWFLMSSPFPTLSIVILYVIVVNKGQIWMKDRQAFNLKPFIVLYNLFLVILSIYMVAEFVLSAWSVPGFSWACQQVDYSDDPTSKRLANVIWWYFFSKIIELLDTIFFMLRKKNNQISFLHMYHHSTMPLLWWIGTKFVPGGEAFFSPTINSFIHVLMYSYYMLSAMGPAMQPYLWWKKYMTSLQLIQFWLIIFKTSYSIYLDCGYPQEYGYALVAYCMSHVVLFSNFYYHTYTKQARLQREKKLDQINAPELKSGEQGLKNGGHQTNIGNGSVEMTNGNKHLNGVVHRQNGHIK